MLLKCPAALGWAITAHTPSIHREERCIGCRKQGGLGYNARWAQGNPGLRSLRSLHWVRQHAPRLPHSNMKPKAVSWPKHRASRQSSQRAGLTAPPTPGSQMLQEVQMQEQVTSQGTQDSLRGHPPFQDHRPLRKNSEGLRSTGRKAR